MKISKINKIGGGLTLLLAAVVLVAPAKATDVSCVTPEQTLGTAVVGSGNGCTYVNANFLTFNAGTPTGAGDGNFPVPATGASTNLEFGASGNPTYILDFRTSGQTTTQGLTGACVADSWCVKGASADASQTITYDATATTGTFYGLTLADGTVTTGELRGSDTITVQEQYCVGGASIATCSAADLGSIKIVQTTPGSTTAIDTGGFTAAPVITICQATITGGACTPVTSTLAEVGIAGGSKNITIQDAVTITSVSDEQDNLFIDSFNDGFQTTPEPSTFILMGSALAGVAALKFRKQKQQS
jgi:hypothetical protein